MCENSLPDEDAFRATRQLVMNTLRRNERGCVIFLARGKRGRDEISRATILFIFHSDSPPRVSNKVALTLHDLFVTLYVVTLIRIISSVGESQFSGNAHEYPLDIYVAKGHCALYTVNMMMGRGAETPFDIQDPLGEERDE